MPKTNRKYGFFRCTKCKAQWESAYVHCIEGTDNDYYKQECKRCNIACSPYRVEELKCAVCGETKCVCSREDREGRHTDLNKPHRSDLCERCKSGRSCLYS